MSRNCYYFWGHQTGYVFAPHNGHVDRRNVSFPPSPFQLLTVVMLKLFKNSSINEYRKKQRGQRCHTRRVSFFSVELVEDDHTSDDMTVIWSAEEEGRGGQVVKKGARRRAGADYSAVISKIFVTFVPLSSSTAAPNRKTPF